MSHIRRRWIVACILAVLICCCVYVVSFITLRRNLSVTFAVKSDEASHSPRLHSIRVFYFSPNPAINYCLWNLYWPLHRSTTSNESLLKSAIQGARGDQPIGSLRRVTVRDMDTLSALELKL
jgi:hypothetical protein